MLGFVGTESRMKKRIERDRWNKYIAYDTYQKKKKNIAYDVLIILEKFGWLLEIFSK